MVQVRVLRRAQALEELADEGDGAHGALGAGLGFPFRPGRAAIIIAVVVVVAGGVLGGVGCVSGVVIGGTS